MKSICNFDRQINKKTIKKYTPSICICLTLVTGLLATPALFGGGFFSVFAADKEFKIHIDIDEDPIKRGDTQDITVTVKNDDTGKRISNADVKLTVYPPASDSTSAKDKTNDDGEAKFKVKIDDDAETGEYDVKVKVSKDGYDTKTVNTSFDVIKKNYHDENGDDNNGDDHNGDGSSSAAAASAASGSAASSASNGGGSSAASAASGNAAAAAAASNSAAAASAASGGSSAASSAASGGTSSAVVAVAN